VGFGGLMAASRPPRGAYLPGFSAMVAVQILHDRLPQMIRQLERNPNADPRAAQELRATWRNLKAASKEFLNWREELPSVTSAEVPQQAAGSDSCGPLGWDLVGSVAERLECSTRWVRQLINTGRLSATKTRSGHWLVDPASVELYLEVEKEMAA
jgi:excisionase family DNA binding protein